MKTKPRAHMETTPQRSLPTRQMMEGPPTQEQMAKLEALKFREQVRQRNQDYMRGINATMADSAVRRIQRGRDTFEGYQTRGQGIISREGQEAHIIWNTQNFLEQLTERLENLDKERAPRPIAITDVFTREQADEILDAYQSEDQTRIAAVRRKYRGDMGE